MDYFDHEEFGAVFGQGFQNSISPNMINILSSNTITTSLQTFPTINTTAPIMKQHLYNNKPINHSNFPRSDHGVINHHQPSNSPPVVLNYGNINKPSQNLQQVINNPLPLYHHEDNGVVSEVLIRSDQGFNTMNIENGNESCRPSTKKKTRTRAPSQINDHIIAERKRREQLSQLFIALSAIVPGLKKTDKTSILGDAIKYLKHLRQRLEILEEKSAMDPGVVVKKSQYFVEDEGSSDEKSGGSDEPEIEARVVNNNILMRIHCGKQKGVLANLLSKVESLNMVVVNTNVTPFGNSALDITIIAEMEKGFSLTVKEVATALRAAFREAAA